MAATHRRGAAEADFGSGSGAISGGVARPGAAVPGSEDDLINEEIHAQLRAAAEDRESRAQVVAEENEASARRQFESIMARSGRGRSAATGKRPTTRGRAS
jgi:hypothetical protein